MRYLPGFGCVSPVLHNGGSNLGVFPLFYTGGVPISGGFSPISLFPYFLISLAGVQKGGDPP